MCPASYTAGRAHLKLLLLVGFMLTVVSTPHRWWPAYVGALLVLLTLMGVARIRPGWMLKRMLIEVPFVLFAVLMPFIATGERVHLAMVSRGYSGRMPEL